MKAGAALKEHRAEGNVSIQVLSGSLHLRIDQDALELHASQMAVLNPGVSHSVQAGMETAFLISISG